MGVGPRGSPGLPSRGGTPLTPSAFDRSVPSLPITSAARPLLAFHWFVNMSIIIVEPNQKPCFGQVPPTRVSGPSWRPVTQTAEGHMLGLLPLAVYAVN